MYWFTCATWLAALVAIPYGTFTGQRWLKRFGYVLLVIGVGLMFYIT